MVLASTTADSNVRLIAVKELLSSLSSDGLTPTNKVGALIFWRYHVINVNVLRNLSPQSLFLASKILMNKFSKLSIRNQILSHLFSQSKLAHTFKHSQRPSVQNRNVVCSGYICHLSLDNFTQPSNQNSRNKLFQRLFSLSFYSLSQDNIRQKLCGILLERIWRRRRGKSLRS